MLGCQAKDREEAAQKEIWVSDSPESQAKSQLSGDQFNIYVANRFVVPSLNKDQQSQMFTGLLTLEILTQQYIHQNFRFRYLIGNHNNEAFAIERLLRGGYIFNQRPHLNPLESSTTVSDC